MISFNLKGNTTNIILFNKSKYKKYNLIKYLVKNNKNIQIIF